MGAAITIVQTDPRTETARKLVAELDDYLATLYPPETNILLDIEALASPQMRFFSAYLDNQALGCGGIWLHEDYAEVKRVYVNPKARGFGIAKKIMARLEDETRAAGMKIIRLEAGILQPAALGLYRALGYADRGPFGDYPTDDPRSVFMEKRLG